MDREISAIMSDIKIDWQPTKEEFTAIAKIVSGEKPRKVMDQCGLQYKSRHPRYRSLTYIAGFLVNLFVFVHY